MASNSLAINMGNDNLEENLVTLLEKLEAIRESKGPVEGLSKNYRQPIQVEIRTLEFWRSIISECLATFFFVFIVCGAGLNYLNKGIDKTNELTLATALATGLSMTLLHQCFGKISGGHVNPAVSLAMAATKKITPLRASLFVVAQCGGGIAGAALLYGKSIKFLKSRRRHPRNPVRYTIVERHSSGTSDLINFLVTSPGPYPATPTTTLGPWERFGVELVLTFIVVFTHFSTRERKSFNNGSAMIGAAYGACTMAGIPMLNPARALGPAFVMNKLWDNHWVFWFGPVLGGVMAAIIHEFIFNPRRHNKRPTDSIDGDSSSIHSEDEPFDGNKYHPAAYRPVGPGNSTSPGYCPSVASTSMYSSPPARLERVESLCNGGKYKQQPNPEGIYSGTRSLYNAKVTDSGIYSGTKSMYSKSPPLTRANLNRSQSVYAKSQNPRDLLPKPGPLIPAQSLYPIKLGNGGGGGGHLTANIRDFGAPNFISGIKTTDGNFIKLSQANEHSGGTGFNQNTLNFLAGRNGGSRSYHDVSDVEKTSFQQQQQQQQQNFGVGDHLTNQNVQNQIMLNSKPEKSGGENIYGIRNSPTGGIYPGNEPPRPENKREAQVKRDCYDVIPRSHDSRCETPRSQMNSNFNRTAAYVKSVQNNPGYKTRESNYDIVPSGIREVGNFNQKPHNRSDTSDYGSNSLTNQFSE